RRPHRTAQQPSDGSARLYSATTILMRSHCHDRTDTRPADVSGRAFPAHLRRRLAHPAADEAGRDALEGKLRAGFADRLRVAVLGLRPGAPAAGAAVRTAIGVAPPQCLVHPV